MVVPRPPSAGGGLPYKLRKVFSEKILMSKELQEKADKIIKELQEALIPIRKEIVIKNIKNNNARKI
jgi:hypothetical protein